MHTQRQASVNTKAVEHPVRRIQGRAGGCNSWKTSCIAGVALLANTVLAGDWSLITLDPGHFHAALLQREMLPGISEEAFVYAPLGPDLSAHLNRVAQFNRRQEHPTHWRLRVYAGPDFQERMLREHPGQIVVMSGRNRGKIDRILGSIRAGLHVLADKPWIIEPEDLPKLATALDEAQSRGVIAYDAMTQRFEITFLLQRALVNDPDVFGHPLPGSPAEPAVNFESLHYLFKEVSGVPNYRPSWFFDVAEQGEGLSDVGTHLADIVPWILFPDQAIRHESEIQVLSGKHWPTRLSLPEFQRVTGEKELPASLRTCLKDGKFEYFCNNSVAYSIRGVHVNLKTTWDFAPTAGAKDTELVIFRGSRARIEMRQDAREQYRREVYVAPNRAEDLTSVLAALKRRLTVLQSQWPGLGVEVREGRFRILLPDELRAGHEEHFAQVAQRFLLYARHPETLPAWEKAAMLSKYYVTTKGVQLARQASTQP